MTEPGILDVLNNFGSSYVVAAINEMNEDTEGGMTEDADAELDTDDAPTPSLVMVLLVIWAA